MKLLLCLLAVLIPTGVVCAQSPYDLFVKNFNQGVKFSNDNTIAKEIRARPREAITHFESLFISKLHRKEDAERYDVPLAKLKEGFKKVFEVRTLDMMQEYYERADADKINQLSKFDVARTQLHNQWLVLKEARDRKGILALVDEGAKLGRQCDEMGHRIKAATVYASLAAYVNVLPNHTDQDTLDTIDYAKMFMAQRKIWEWTKDPTYIQWSNWVKNKEIEVKGAAKEAEKREAAGLKEGEGLVKLVDTKTPPLTGTLEFHALKNLPEDSSFVGGSVPVNWLSTRISADAAKMFYFKKKDLFLVRTGPNKLAVSLSSTGENPMQVDAGTKVKPSTIYLGANKTDPYSIGFFIGSSTEPFAAAVTNVAPTKESLIVYYRSFSSWETTIAGEEVTFYDDNCDGKIMTKDPIEYGFKSRLQGGGPKDDEDIAVYDSMKIGKKGEIVPFSSAAKIGDSWYLLEQSGPNTIKASRLHPEFFHTGTVSMKWSGSRAVKPQLLILRGRDSLQSTAFNIAEGKSVELPVGQYDIVYGRSAKGKGGQTQMVHIFKGDSKVIKVEQDKKVVVKLGGPFKFDFVKGGDGTDIELNSLYFQIKGVAGELYAKIQGPLPAPEVVVAKSSSGRGAKVVGTYVRIESPDVLNTAAQTLDKMTSALNVRAMGVNVAYFPVVKGDKDASTVMKFKAPFPGALVGLREKKNKLFGKIESLTFK